MSRLSSRLQSRISLRRNYIAAQEEELNCVKEELCMYRALGDAALLEVEILSSAKRALRLECSAESKDQQLDKELLKMVYAQERRSMALSDASFDGHTLTFSSFEESYSEGA